MRPTEAFKFTNILADQTPFRLAGGYYAIQAVPNGVPLDLQMLGPDGTTYFSILALTQTVQAKFLPPGTYKVAATVPISAEAQAVINAMSPTPNAARQNLIAAFVGALQDTGVWVKLDLLYVLAADTAANGLINWKNPGTFTAAPITTTAAFTADRGYTGNGTSDAFATGWVPSVNGVNFVRDDASIWLWNLKEIEYALGDMGSKSTSAIQTLLRAKTSNVMGGRINDATLSPQPAVNSAIGMFGISRRDANSHYLWKNGVLRGFGTSFPSTGINPDNQWFLGCNPSAFSPQQQALLAWGASLTGLENAFYSAANDYMIGVGAVAGASSGSVSIVSIPGA